jgi:hypothetical protein
MMLKLTVVARVPPALSVAATLRVNIPAWVGVPVIVNTPLPLCTAVRLGGNPVALALVRGSVEAMIKWLA